VHGQSSRNAYLRRKEEIVKLALLFCFVPAALFCAGAPDNHHDLGYLKVNVTPDNAGVFLDGVYMGPSAHSGSAMKYGLPPGKYEITMIDPRCEDSSATVEIVAGKTATINETMKAKAEAQGPFATLRVLCDKNLAAVIVSGNYIGDVAEFNRGLPVSPGTYDLRIDVGGGESLLWERVTFVAGQTTVVRWD
jgi:hypothetical protein